MKFAQPAWLVLLVLLPLLGAAAVVVARMRGRQWAAFIAPRLRGALLKRGSTLPRWFALLFLLAACAAITIALARPQGDAGVRTEKSLGRNLLIALDLSRSMRVADIKPDRLSRAKMVIYELLESMPNERVGVIGFAGNAYIYAPLTVDHQAVRETVEQIDETWTTQGGSNLGEAIKLASETLRKTSQKNNALVILSDGEKHDGHLDDIIDQARESGVFILAIGVGTEDGDYVPSPDFPGGRMVDRRGQPVVSRLQADVMRKLATETRGRYAVAGTGADIASMVGDAVKDLDAFEIEGRERAVSIEFYQWLLFPALVFLLASILAATRWRGVNPALVATAIMLAPGPARADKVSAAKEALKKGNQTEARDAYRKLADGTRSQEHKARFHLGEATAAYRAKDFRGARSAFSQAMMSGEPKVRGSAHLGTGKTLFQLGWQSLAGEPYPDDAANSPTLADFDAIVRKKLEEVRAGDESGSDPTAMEALITNWADGVRHFDSALAANPTDRSAAHNRAVVMTYLKRLQELLEEEREQAEQSMPQPRQGEGKPEPRKPGEGDPREEGEPEEEGQDQKGPKQQGDQGDQGEDDEDPKDGSGDEEEKPDDKSGKKEDEEESGESPRDPNESPEERARRILKENADLEKGPLTPGRREFNPPEKDW
ncbi:MAG: VWA domain-containing protein [Luteolibacter sp.]|nr:VWA domain-containing protein [Luteolibacter sp.]